MTPEQKMEFTLDLYMGCFGSYRKNDPICRNRCAQNLRCAIENDQNQRFEILEELVSANNMAFKVN